jgi:hypothetical protein
VPQLIYVLVNGSVYSWGHNLFGQLGIETSNSTSPYVSSPQLVSSLPNNIKQIACGMSHSLAHNGYTVYSWGSNEHGELGRKKGKNELPGEVEMEPVGMDLRSSVSGLATSTNMSSSPANSQISPSSSASNVAASVYAGNLNHLPPLIQFITCGTNNSACITGMFRTEG